MEAQLREYRARKAQERADKQKQQNDDEGVWTRIWGSKVRDQRDAADDGDDQHQATSVKILTTPAVNSLRGPVPRHRFLALISRDHPALTNVVVLKLSLWLVLFALFLHLEFAAVFVIISFFYVIYATLGSRRRAAGEPSAYSVFNPNCERIDGTLTGDQFERELKYGIGSTRQ